jgi:hypothetical protein
MIWPLVLVFSGCSLTGGADLRDSSEPADTSGPGAPVVERVFFHLELPGAAVVDPKLEGEIALPLLAVADEAPAGQGCALHFEAEGRGGQRRTWAPVDSLVAGGRVTTSWDGRDDAGQPFDPGPVRVLARATCEGGAASSAVVDVGVARLGVVRVDLVDHPDGGHVPLAFHKVDLYADSVNEIGVAVPEYENGSTSPFDLGDLDENDGSARVPVAPWANPDFPPWGAGEPEAVRHNVPAGYVAGTKARFSATVGAVAVSPTTGLAVQAFGEEHLELRLVAEGLDAVNANAPVEPNGTLSFDLDLPDVMGRQEIAVTWHFETRTDDGWVAVPGSMTTRHVVYLLAGPPVLRDGTAIGASPALTWIAVLDHLDSVISGLPADPATLLDAIRDDLNHDPYILYDPSDWAYSEYEGAYIYWDYIVSDLSGWLDRDDGLALYCHSFSCLLSGLAGSVGVDAPQLVLGVGFHTNLMCAAGTTSWRRYNFNSHSVVSPDKGLTIWDATSDLDGDDDPYDEPVKPVSALGMDGEEYLWRLTYDEIGIVNSGLCYIE